MDYYLDQEFNEYFKKPIPWLPTIGRFNKPYHTIELISIGLVAEDGREYYAVCSEFDVKAAYKKYQVEKHRNYGDSRNISEYRYERKYWLRENVLAPIFFAFYKTSLVNLHHVTDMSLSKMKDVIKSQGKSKKQIALDVVNFIDQRYLDGDNPSRGFIYPAETSLNSVSTPDLSFYGYYSDYDWVVFCSLFGTMMDLPKGFPMYCKDLKQILDESALKVAHKRLAIAILEDTETESEFLAKQMNYVLEAFTNTSDYPKHENEHHALADAKWNKRLHEFLKTI